MKSKELIYKIIFIILIFVLATCNISVYATDEIIEGAEEFLAAGDDSVLDHTRIRNTSDSVFNIFSVFGTVIVLIVGAVLGLQFIIGSTEEKAKIKESLIPYVIGSIVIFAAVGIWSLFMNVFQDLF